MENHPDEHAETTTEGYDSHTLTAIGDSLRAIRRQRGLTLRDVERESAGRWKAVVVGSYERGDRALTLKRAVGLASFYNVPLDQLLGLFSPKSSESRGLVLNLAAIRGAGNEIPASMVRYLQEICRLRSDWNGVMLSVRGSDLIALSTMADVPTGELTQWAIDRGLLLH